MSKKIAREVAKLEEEATQKLEAEVLRVFERYGNNMHACARFYTRIYTRKIEDNSSIVFNVSSLISKNKVKKKFILFSVANCQIHEFDSVFLGEMISCHAVCLYV